MMQDTCEIYCYDEEKVNRLKPDIAKANLKTIARLFKALADETRVKIMYALCREKELCVCDIANVIGASVANTSHHLRLLKNMKLAKSRKEKKLVFYSLDDDHVQQLMQITMEHLEESHAGISHPIETDESTGSERHG